MNTQVEVNTVNTEDMVVTKKNTSNGTKAGLIFPVVTIQKNAKLRDFQKENFTKEDKDGNIRVGKVRMDIKTNVFVTSNLEYIAKVMMESVLRSWMTNSNETLRLNHEIIHGSLAQPNNSELNAIFPHSVLETVRDSVSYYRTIDEAYKNKKKGKDYDHEAYELALNNLKELYPTYLHTDKDTGIERFTFSYNCSNKLVKICKDIYNNNDVHTHEQQDEQDEHEEHDEHDEKDENDENDEQEEGSSKKSSITLNEQAKLYFAFLIDYLYNRIIMTTVKSTCHLCDSNKEINSTKGAKKTIKEVNVRVTLETIIPSKLGIESMNYASDRVIEFTTNKELMAKQKLGTEQSEAEQSEVEQSEVEQSEAEQSEPEQSKKKSKKSKKSKSSTEETTPENESGTINVESKSEKKKAKKAKKSKKSETNTDEE